MNPDLEHLIVLQAQDLELQKLQQERGDVPRRVTTSEAAHKAAEKALLAAQEGLAREEKLRRSQEIDADGHRGKIARLRKQMDTAANGAQISALEHEINFGEAAIRKLEDEEIASLERTEEIETLCDKATAELAMTRTALENERTCAAATLERVRVTIAALEAERAALRMQIGEGPLATYDRVSKSRGTGVSEAVDHKCSACQMMVRPQRWNELTARDDDEHLFTCETCGRILFYDPRRDVPGAWAAGERLTGQQPKPAPAEPAS